MSGAVNVADFAFPSDPDDTLAFQRAAATGRSLYAPAKPYIISDMINLQKGQMLFGDGATKSVLSAFSNFNMSALGVLGLGGGEPGACLRDIGISFDQPFTTSRVDMRQYPPAIHAYNTPRFKVQNCRVTGGWDGLDARGNTGGAMISQFECGAINKGIRTDGALDFFHITDAHFWPFGFQDDIRKQAYGDGGTIAGELLNIDGLNVKGWNTFKARTLIGGGTFGTLGGVNLDGRYSRLEMASGNVVINGFYKTSDLSGDYAARLSSGHLTIDSIDVSGVNGTQPYFECAGANTQAAIMAVTGGIIRSGPSDAPIFQDTLGILSVANVTFGFGVNTVRTAGFVRQLNGRLRMTGCYLADRGTGSGPGIEIANDNFNVVVGNCGLNWAAIYPATVVNSIYSGNTPASWNR